MSNEQKLREDKWQKTQQMAFALLHAPFDEVNGISTKAIADELFRLSKIETAHDILLSLAKAQQALATTEPAVNQQLTTEPFGERGAFEKWCAQYIYTRPALQESLGGCVPPDAVWAAWQARAAMARGVK